MNLTRAALALLHKPWPRSRENGDDSASIEELEHHGYIESHNAGRYGEIWMITERGRRLLTDLSSYEDSCNK